MEYCNDANYFQDKIEDVSAVLTNLKYLRDALLFALPEV
jgi:hypothetical protein